MKEDLTNYQSLLSEIKDRVRKGQIKANLSANSEMLTAYWDIGRIIHHKQEIEGWGRSVIPRLSRDLRNELPEVKGFSERNIGYMVIFYREYSRFPILQQPVAKLHSDAKASPAHSSENDNSIIQRIDDKLQHDNVLLQLILMTSWSHHIILMQKIKDFSIRYWYMRQCLSDGWSRDTLSDMIKNRLHERQGNFANNFDFTLPPLQSELARQTLKDPYIFDFLTLSTQYTERELEVELVKHLEKFLVELGSGFAFVGRQYKLPINDRDYYLDLLFYHIKMRCFVVIELKKGEFMPEYAGKMNFYCSAVDDILRHPTDQPTIGLILCKSKDKLFVEYALRDIHKPIGISEYELTRILPDDMKSSLPSVEQIEEELGMQLEDKNL